MKYNCTGEVYSNKQIATNIYDMYIFAPDIAKNAKAGQFVNVYTKSPETILPRPISIAETNLENKTIRIIYGIVGKGTAEFSNLKIGDSIKLVGALGNGFDINSNLTEHIILAGGIGTPPMLGLAKNLIPDFSKNSKVSIKAYLGFRSEPILVEEFEKLGVEVHIATDDGNVGFKGNNIALVRQENPNAQMIYACGPKVMLRAAAKWATEKEIPMQVSMEEHMACGIGACGGCVCKTKARNKDDWEHTKICMNGPVFLSSEVIWND